MCELCGLSMFMLDGCAYFLFLFLYLFYFIFWLSHSLTQSLDVVPDMNMTPGAVSVPKGNKHATPTPIHIPIHLSLASFSSFSLVTIGK